MITNDSIKAILILVEWFLSGVQNKLLNVEIFQRRYVTIRFYNCCYAKLNKMDIMLLKCA